MPEVDLVKKLTQLFAWRNRYPKAATCSPSAKAKAPPDPAGKAFPRRVPGPQQPSELKAIFGTDRGGLKLGSSAGGGFGMRQNVEGANLSPDVEPTGTCPDLAEGAARFCPPEGGCLHPENPLLTRCVTHGGELRSSPRGQETRQSTTPGGVVVVYLNLCCQPWGRAGFLGDDPPKSAGRF